LKEKLLGVMGVRPEKCLASEVVRTEERHCPTVIVLRGNVREGSLYCSVQATHDPAHDKYRPWVYVHQLGRVDTVVAVEHTIDLTNFLESHSRSS